MNQTTRLHGFFPRAILIELSRLTKQYPLLHPLAYHGVEKSMCPSFQLTHNSLRKLNEVSNTAYETLVVYTVVCPPPSGISKWKSPG